MHERLETRHCIAYSKQAYEYGIKADGNFPLEPLINYDLLSAYASTDSLVKSKVYFENI
ncbi:hypothetical protein [Winogradskyella sp.]|uniref:hypothetical protein n=1 Tax=Winogradskyella sp. TaxID=1883156 RepID=UPI003BAC5FEB